MSLRGKDFRCELDPELHERLRLMADFNDRDLASFGARLLEKCIVGEWHEFNVLRERLERSGASRNSAESRGVVRNLAADGGRKR